MDFGKTFNRLFTRKRHKESINDTPRPLDEMTAGWDDLAALNHDQSSITFDDLADLSYPSGAGVNESSLTPDTNIEQSEELASPELQAIKDYFELDLRIKSELIRLAPNELDNFDETSRIAYADRAYKAFQGFHYDFARVNANFNFEDTVDASLDEYFERGAKNFEIGNYRSGITRELYHSEFSSMRQSFVELVKDQCVGYTLHGDEVLGSLIQESASINELLHAYHSYIMNNEEILQAIPVISEKHNEDDALIALRGEESESARQIFDAIPDNLAIGDTDIIAAGERVMMMVRDRGHALTIGASPDSGHPDRVWVEYHIPKLCNIQMIEALPGLSGYTDNGAQGGFFAQREELGSEIANFIGQVPTDSDMYREGGEFYRGND